jgi:hypothetical protein
MPNVIRALSVVTASLGLLVSGALVRAAAHQSAAQSAAASDADVRARCGTACHKFPPPEILPRGAWRGELIRMMLLQEGVPETQTSPDLLPLPPDWLPILRYYEARAPEQLPAPEPWPAVSTSKSGAGPGAGPGPTFQKHAISRILDSKSPAIANVRFLDLDGDKRLDIVASDMRNGQVVVADAKVEFGLKTVATLRSPGHIEMVDLDRDGRQDLLIADLGTLQPADHDKGAVHWLRRQADGTFTPVILADKLPRVADARAADFDADGDLDVIAAAFGWRRTGSVLLLENRTPNGGTAKGETAKGGAPNFVVKTIDARSGSIHVPVADLNKDGRPDVVSLLAQEHETVVAYLNTSTGTGGTGKGAAFKTETIYAAPHPNWGSSGIELVDLDTDGDLDVLMTHGDTFDDFILKPYHGLLWLENRGTFPFTPHPLATLPGAQRAQTADLDGDGDLDIVATAMVAGSGDLEPTLPSIVWLEQVRARVFERRTLEVGAPHHATLDIADVDGDGDPDLAVGWCALVKPVDGFLDLWENLRVSRPAASPAAPR